MIKVILYLPYIMRITGSKEVFTEGETLRQIIEHIDEKYPGFKENMLDKEGRLYNYMQAFVKFENKEYSEVIEDLDNELIDPLEIRFIPISDGG